MQTYSFWGHTIEITDSLMRTIEIEREIEKVRASTATVAENYKYMYKMHSNLKITLELFSNDLDKFRGRIIDMYAEKLKNDGFNITPEVFKEKYVEPNTRFPDSYFALQKEFERRRKIELEKRDKADKDEVLAHNFGDASTASGVKMGSAIGGFIGDLITQESTEFLYVDSDTLDVLVEAIVEGLACTHTAYAIAYNDLSGTNHFTLKQSYETSAEVKKFKEKATQYHDTKPEAFANRFAELLQQYPYSHQLYIDILTTMQDPQGELEAISSTFATPEQFARMKIRAAADFLPGIKAKSPDAMAKDAAFFDDLCYNRLRLRGAEAYPVMVFVNCAYSSVATAQYYTHDALSVFHLRNVVDEYKVQALSDGVDEHYDRFEPLDSYSGERFSGRFIDTAFRLRDNMTYFKENVYRTVLGTFYDDRDAASAARQRTWPAQELYHNTNFSDYGAVDMLYKTLHGQQQAGVLSAAEYNWLMQKAQRAAQLSPEIDQYMVNLPSYENDFAYRHERIEHFFRAVAYEWERRWLGMGRTDLNEWRDKRRKALCELDNRISLDSFTNFSDADKVYYEKLGGAYAYLSYLQRQNQPRGFFDKLKSGIQDIQAKNHKRTYDTITRNGQEPLPPMIENEVAYVKQLHQNINNHIDQMSANYRATYYPHLVNDKKEYDSFAQEYAHQGDAEFIRVTMVEAAEVLAKQYSL